ncbi:uncharacterized protein [Spinacia oleracea]|uniref:Uncharacterized protein n=1 Tax=Spinacia oleracea TaxID=3562 RepID=A0ABM3R3V0_SPIOL|nr:uncharacterized protein LOC130465524 [Spinacia oleracea]
MVDSSDFLPPALPNHRKKRLIFLVDKREKKKGIEVDKETKDYAKIIPKIKPKSSSLWITCKAFVNTFSGGSRGTSDPRSQAINSIEPSEEARSISASFRPKETLPNNDMFIWNEQLRGFCGAVHKQCRVLDNWSEKTKQEEE